MIALFSSFVGHGFLADMNAVVDRLKARPNLRKLLDNSYFVNGSSAKITIENLEIKEFTMGDKNSFSGAGPVVHNSTIHTQGGAFAMRDVVSGGIGQQELEELFAPLRIVLSSSSTPDIVNNEFNELKLELAKGNKADDKILANIVKGIADLVPGAISAIVGAFGTPLLGAVVGPATKYVINSITKDGEAPSA